MDENEKEPFNELAAYGDTIYECLTTIAGIINLYIIGNAIWGDSEDLLFGIIGFGIFPVAGFFYVLLKIVVVIIECCVVYFGFHVIGKVISNFCYLVSRMAIYLREISEKLNR